MIIGVAERDGEQRWTSGPRSWSPRRRSVLTRGHLLGDHGRSWPISPLVARTVSCSSVRMGTDSSPMSCTASRSSSSTRPSFSSGHGDQPHQRDERDGGDQAGDSSKSHAGFPLLRRVWSGRAEPYPAACPAAQALSTSPEQLLDPPQPGGQRGLGAVVGRAGSSGRRSARPADTAAPRCRAAGRGRTGSPSRARTSSRRRSARPAGAAAPDRSGRRARRPGRRRPRSMTALDLGARARAITAWARLIRPSGMPMKATASAAATAVSARSGRPARCPRWPG